MSGFSPCYICGGPISELALDPRDMKTKPCATCNTIIAEMVNESPDDDFVAYLDTDLSEFDELLSGEGRDILNA